MKFELFSNPFDADLERSDHTLKQWHIEGDDCVLAAQYRWHWMLQFHSLHLVEHVRVSSFYVCWKLFRWCAKPTKSGEFTQPETQMNLQ